MFGRGKGKSPEGGGSGSKPPERPFGEDITNPDSRTIPPPFHGRWGRPSADGSIGVVEEIEPRRIVLKGRSERVIAVRYITQQQIAVVTRENDAAPYSLHYRGLTDSNTLVDLENTDWVLKRVD